MTTDVAFVFGVVLLALVLFTWDRFRVDAVAVGVLLLLAISGVVTPKQALAGFSSIATITVAAMFVLSAGLRRTGALAGVAGRLARVGRRSELLALASMMVIVAAISAFINNTAAVAIFIPVVVDLARHLGVSPSRFLLPLSFASMFGGIATLVGTSTNLLADAIAIESGLEGFGMFEFTPLALALFGIGLLYLLAVRHLIPARRPPDEPDDLGARYGVDLRSTDRDGLVEAIIPQDSPVAGRRVAELDLAQRHGAAAVALRAAGAAHPELPLRPLRSGDSLLLRISADRIEGLKEDESFVLVDSEVEEAPPRRSLMPAALGIVAAVVVLAATGVLPIVLAALTGALAMVAVGVLTGEEAYESINWTVILLLAGVIPLGTALESTGGALLLSEAIVDALERFGPVWVLAGLFLLTQLVTSVISNNASVVVFAPIAIAAAERLGADPRPFLFAVTIAASMSFVTPVGYQTNTMVYGPGDYRFSDFVRIGGPLTLLVFVASTLLIPRLWPL